MILICIMMIIIQSLSIGHIKHIYINAVYTIINLCTHITVKCNSHGSMMIFNIPQVKNYIPHYNFTFILSLYLDSHTYSAVCMYICPPC